VANPVSIATKGKGYSGLVKRISTINKRYGFTPTKMDRALALFIDVLQKYNCGATFPITASALGRNGSVIEKYQAQNIEFAMHGLFHIDYSRLSLNEQNDHIQQAKQIFTDKHIHLAGFRCPYLRWNEETLTAVSNHSLSYDSSQALFWDVLGNYNTDDYQHVLRFYRAKSATTYPALPKITNGAVQIPYCVPDDEALIERLRLLDTQAMSDIWVSILNQTYELGELFTLGLHPERISLLQEPLANTLARARGLSPNVWIARLDEITNWWCTRNQATFELKVEQDDVFHLTVSGPPGSTVLAREVDVHANSEPWYGGFDRILETDFIFRAGKRPCIGLSPHSDPALADFLTQQGYWIETDPQSQAYSIYLEQPEFTPADERPLLHRLDHGKEPLIRLGRWPHGAQSAMCVTGDIDALTLWDYLLRFLGK